MRQETMEWLRFVQSSSIPLVNVDAARNPTRGIASGCLIEYAGNRLLFSVFHATGTSSSWLIPLRYDSIHDRTDVYFTPRFNFFVQKLPNLPSLGVPFDLSFILMPRDVVSYFQNLQLAGPVEEREHTVFVSDLCEQPQNGMPYAFSGQVRPAFIPDLATLKIDHCTYPGLLFDRTEGVYHYFKLPVDHPGDDAFEGCSGAPIVGYDRRVVALVVGGSLETNEIYGISISAFKNHIDEFLGLKGATSGA